MTDYRLYYWSAPFRGEFVRAVLAHAGRSWIEASDDRIGALMEGPVAAAPVPFMGPPVLVEAGTDLALSQTPAILLYLGETLGLLPATAAGRALALKVVCDANDLIDDLTLDGGRLMWTERRWRDYQPRLEKWMGLWEETGLRHALTPEAGWLLGGAAPDVADIVTATLWSTLADRLPPIGELLERVAPRTAGLSRRLAATPALAAQAARSREAYGEVWCGGRIEASLRRVLAEPGRPATRGRA